MDRKRLLRVTAGNLKHKHLYIHKHLDFFPPDVVGPARRSGSSPTSRGIELVLDGLGVTIETDISRDAKTGKPRRFLRDRRAIGRFYEHYGVTQGSDCC